MSSWFPLPRESSLDEDESDCTLPRRTIKGSKVWQVRRMLNDQTDRIMSVLKELREDLYDCIYRSQLVFLLRPKDREPNETSM